MKTSVLFLFLLACLLNSAVAQTKVIEQPVVGDSNTDMVDIRRIELSPQSTILSLDLYSCQGYWVNIMSQTVLQSADGKRIYKLLACEGMEMDRQAVIPEQGYLSCKLIFEPLSEQERTIDYVEGPGRDTWTLRDIHLYKEENKRTYPIRCHIRGEVKNRPYSPRLILTRAGGDNRAVGTYIPVRDGKFEYLLECDVCEAYELTFKDELCKGGWRPVLFWAENGEVNMELYPEEEWEKNVIRGGAEDQRYREYRTQQKKAVCFKKIEAHRNRLVEEKRYYSPESEELFQRAVEATDPKVADSLFAAHRRLQITDSIYTPEGLEAENRYLELVKKRRKWEMDYIRKHPSLTTYYVLLESFRRHIQAQGSEDIPRFREHNRMDPQEVEELVQTVFRPLYPEHPYTQEMENHLKVLTDVRVGGRYIDFTAPDLKTGELVTLSEQIRGKIALIDLWASWCGPCRRSAKEMIPVYEKYKDRGFTVVGVAREKLRSSGVEAARRDGHPWTDLIDLNDRERIWEKYGIGNAGGSTFLVDRNGIILAINPTVEEVLEVLENQ